MCPAKIASYDEKMEAFRRLLKQRGEKEARFIPPIYRLFRKFGFHPVPPIFRTFGRNTFFFGCSFGLGFAIVRGFFVLVGWEGEYGGALGLLIVSALMGITIGLMMSCFEEWRKGRVYVGEWEFFGAQYEREQAEPGASGNTDNAR
jgi:hypothetical protein